MRDTPAPAAGARRRYLLIPVPPTPNGRMHLGHMAGPYLRMDMLRRSLEQDGHEAELWTGTDSHDSFVLHRAWLAKSTPTQVCAKFHALIQADMASLDIRVDGFVDTLSGEARVLQERHAVESVEALLAAGLATERAEVIRYDTVHGLPVVGTWLDGYCPRCHAHCVGYFCEGCFTHNQPAELLDATSRRPGGRLVARQVESVFLEIPDPAAHLARLDGMQVLPAAIDVVRRMLATPGRRFRLTVPIDWGLTWRPDAKGQPRSIFEILWEVYTYSELQAARSPDRVPAWRAASDIQVVVACGVDNTVPLLMGCVGVYGHLPQAKPPEHIHINHFVDLEGAKFSTNRHHAIWAGDLAAACHGRADGIRLYLARISPEDGGTNFDIDDFVRHYNEFYVERLHGKVTSALSRLATTSSDVTGAVQAIGALRDRIRAALSPAHLRIRTGVRHFEEWIESHDPGSPGAPSAYWWLKGVALLGHPFVPDLARRVWQVLGHEGVPTGHALPDVRECRTGDWPAVRPQPIDAAAVRALVGRPL